MLKIKGNRSNGCEAEMWRLYDNKQMIGLNKHLAGEASTSKALYTEHWLSSSGAASQLCECLEYIHIWVGGGSSHCIDNGYPGEPHPLCDCDVVIAISYILRSKIRLVRRL